MKKKTEFLEETFHCAKCRGEKAVINKLTLSRSSFSSLLPINSGKYIFVSCALCGFTEIYNLAAYEKQEETKTKKLNQIQEA